uniref:Uncharacterized protein n=1 Tax=Neovison vison TaxID=452646 RepID=A0A8C7BDC8_NEOVI
MQEQPPCLYKKVTSCSIAGFSCGALIPPPRNLPRAPHPVMMPAPKMGAPAMMSVIGPHLPGIMPVGPAPGMRPSTEGHMPMMSAPLPTVMRPPTRPMTPACPMRVPHPART